MSDRRNIIGSVVLAACGIGILVAYKCRVIPRIRAYINDPLRHKRVAILNTVEECRKAVKILEKDLAKFPVLGFDCEWVTVSGSRRPVALLQLSSDSGYCALFRLCNLQHVPKELQKILEDDWIKKLGVAPLDDAKYLTTDYNVQVRGTIDLRHVAEYIGRKPEGLAGLSKSFINVTINKNWRIRCSAWDSPNLTEVQIDYAAKDSLVAIEIFKAMINVKTDPHLPVSEFLIVASQFRDKPFKHSGRGMSGVPGVKGQNTNTPLSVQKRNLATRAKPLYDNCFMEAPDGEPLCTMDTKKAEWYLKKNLATLISEDPLRMRLKFEPSGRAVGVIGAYDLEEKKNHCVVCGDAQNYSRKFVIPKEYRKLYPVEMKSHSSHDIMLLCGVCHRRSAMEDNKFKDKLAAQCGAPMASNLKKLKQYALALLKGNVLPSARVTMETYIRQFHPGQEITYELLEKCTQFDSKFANSSLAKEHSAKVVEYFRTTPESGGLLELERIWRKHFLDTMNPQFLPKHWSVDYNAIRIELRENQKGLRSSSTETETPPSLDK